MAAFHPREMSQEIRTLGRKTSSPGFFSECGTPRELLRNPLIPDEVREKAAQAPPVWDEATKRFWCKTGVNAYDLPDGSEWQRTFRSVHASSKRARSASAGTRTDASDLSGARSSSSSSSVTARKGPLLPHASDTPAGPRRVVAPGRRLASFPSDPDKRFDRASHTEALLKMPCSAGVPLVVQNRPLAFFRFEGRVFVVDAACPHQGASLSEGEVGDIEDMVLGRRYYVRCKVHKFQFDLCTGQLIDGKCPGLKTYDVRVSEAPAPADAQASGAQVTPRGNLEFEAFGEETGEAWRAKVALIEVGFESLPFEFSGVIDDDSF